MSWRRSGEFMLSDCGRYLIRRALLHHGMSYSLWDCDPPDDWLIKLIAVKDEARKCQKLAEENQGIP